MRVHAVQRCPAGAAALKGPLSPAKRTRSNYPLPINPMAVIALRLNNRPNCKRGLRAEMSEIVSSLHLVATYMEQFTPV